MNSGLFAPIAPQGLQQQQQMPAGMPPQGMPVPMPQGMPIQGMPVPMPQGMPIQGMPIQMPAEGWTNPSHPRTPEGNIQTMGIMGQNEAGKYSVGDPTLDRYINLFLA